MSCEEDPGQAAAEAPAPKFTVIPPTVGRVVDFHPGAYAPVEITRIGDQPCKADVVFVWNDRLINIAGYDHLGNPFKMTSVRLIQEGDRPAADNESVCTWMQYQLAQAKKYEALAEGMRVGTADSDVNAVLPRG
jgi:hypothetical protein